LQPNRYNQTLDFHNVDPQSIITVVRLGGSRGDTWELLASVVYSRVAEPRKKEL